MAEPCIRTLPTVPDDVAPDGSEVRLLCRVSGGGMAHFRLPAGVTSAAVSHRTVEELWYFVEGTGQMWRALDGREATDAVEPGVSLSIPVATVFQFRADATGPLCAVGVTIPPWPGSDEAELRQGRWSPTI
jgi:mannose-6-phosphate isomerase-like protein (cupin superfamily)